MATTTTAWTCAAASERGSSHVLKDTENQDAATTFETDDGVAVAVADGHGGPRYVRSAIGSAIAVDVARQFAAELLRGESQLLDAASALPPRIVGEWRRRVDAHLATVPLSPSERAQVGDDTLVAYGATLLMVVCRRDQAVALQLGDGDVVVIRDDGTVVSPLPPEPRNVGGRTTSLCLSDAQESFRVADLGAAGLVPAAILAATDGYGNSFERDDWAPAVMQDLVTQHRRGTPDAIFSALPTWVAESAKVGGDDTTVALVLRSGAPAAAVASPPPAVPVTNPHRRLAELAVAGLVGAVIGATFGFVAAGDGDGQPAIVTTIPVATPREAPTTSPAPAPTRPPVATVAPQTSAPSTSVSTVPPTSAPSTEPSTPPMSPSAPVATAPSPRVEQVSAVDRTVIMAVGPYRLEVDPSTDPIAIGELEPSDGATPIVQVLTEGGRWDVIGDTLRFAPTTGQAVAAWEPADGAQVAGLAFSNGRVVAAALATDDAGDDVVTVGVFDGTTGAELAIALGPTESDD